MTWYVETHQVRRSRSPSSINSSSWFRPGMSPKGVVGLNIAWSTALSCAEAILQFSEKRAEKHGKKGKPWHLNYSWVENSSTPHFCHFQQPIKEGGGRRGGLWDLPELVHICIWLTQKFRPWVSAYCKAAGRMAKRSLSENVIAIWWFLLSLKWWPCFYYDNQASWDF